MIRRWLSLTPFAIVAATAVWIVATWFHREFNHDDFFFAYQAWLNAIRAVPYRDYYLNGLSIHCELAAPLFRLFPHSFAPLFIARGVMLVAVATLSWLVYAVARALGASRSWAAAAIVLTICQPDVVTRMSDIRTDPFAAVFLLSSTVILLHFRRQADVRAGFCLGLAVAFALKVVLAAPLLAVALVVRKRESRLSAFIRFSCSAALPPLAYYAWRFVALGRAHFLRALAEPFHAIAAIRSNIGGTFDRFVLLSPVTPVAILLGLAGFVVALSRRNRTMLPAVWYASSVALFLVATLVVNPFIFPYNYMILMPLLAPIVGGVPHLFRESDSVSGTALLVGICVLAFSYAAAPLRLVTERRDSAQIALVGWIWRNTPPESHVFDWQGMAFGRPSIYHWWTFTGRQPSYFAGEYAVADELRRYQVSLIVRTFRLGYLKASDLLFVKSHYVWFSPCLAAPGVYASPAELRAGKAFDIFVPGNYRVESDGNVQIDGVTVAPAVQLTAGAHIVRSAGAVASSAAIYFTGQRERVPPPCPAGDLLHGFN